MMNNKLVATIVIVALVVLGFWYFSQQSVQAPAGDEMMEESGDTETPMDEGEANETTITYTEDGFDPGIVTIAKGETVRFVNESGVSFWPASAMHPTHTVYPGSDIELCATAEAVGLFDACGHVASGESWSFTFDEDGEWGYHDHLNASHFGKVVVE